MTGQSVYVVGCSASTFASAAYILKSGEVAWRRPWVQGPATAGGGANREKGRR